VDVPRVHAAAPRAADADGAVRRIAHPARRRGPRDPEPPTGPRFALQRSSAPGASMSTSTRPVSGSVSTLGVCEQLPTPTSAAAARYATSWTPPSPACRSRPSSHGRRATAASPAPCANSEGCWIARVALSQGRVGAVEGSYDPPADQKMHAQTRAKTIRVSVGC
jgi:hypothetical protein